ncbi:MAG TPA: hypothetical protein VI756_08960, partial [Blastocatellia bacterium]
MKKTFPRGFPSRAAKTATGSRSRSATGAAAAGPTVAGVKITHPERVVYATGGVTKLMVAEY